MCYDIIVCALQFWNIFYKNKTKKNELENLFQALNAQTIFQFFTVSCVPLIF